MTPEETPVGTLCCVGHPANGIIARKMPEGHWVYIHSGEKILDFDMVHKSFRALWIPGYETKIEGFE